MKSLIFEVNHRAMLNTTMLLAVILLCFSTCKRETAKAGKPGAVDETKAELSSQPLPGGKANFSLGEGNFDASSATWARLANWTFNASTGTVAETYWQWDSSHEHNKQAYNSHTCTFDGVTKTATTYTPYGWGTPGGYYIGWSGTYTYNTSTGALHIDWPGGYWENWTVTNQVTGLAQAMFVSGNYGITHGKAYGSNASWSTYKTIAEIPKIPYTGNRCGASLSGSTITVTPWTTSGAAIDLTSFTYPSSPTPANCMHAWLGTTVCTGPCATARIGRVYHLAGMSGSRSLVYNSFCACLPYDSEWPVYNRGLHHIAFQEIIDDSGAMRGMIGVGAEDDLDTPLFYAYQIMEVTNVP
jgi:hypothetical protein